MSTWSADYNDPDNFIYTFFGNEEKTRIRSINYPDTEVMERVAKARTIVNEDERLAEYKALEEKHIALSAPKDKYITHPFISGSLEGYFTMDLVAALAFSVVIVNG